jgi:hypothetical protein
MWNISNGENEFLDNYFSNNDGKSRSHTISGHAALFNSNRPSPSRNHKKIFIHTSNNNLDALNSMSTKQANFQKTYSPQRKKQQQVFRTPIELLLFHI